MNNQTDYTILDHMITVGQIPDPTETIKLMRNWNRGHLKLKLPYYKSFNRLGVDEDGYQIKTMGLEIDNVQTDREYRSWINTSPPSVADYFNAAEVYDITGVLVNNPELWGSKLREYKELTGKEWEDRE